METLEINPFDLVLPDYEKHRAKHEVMTHTIFDFYEEAAHNSYKQWERMSFIGRLAIDIIFKHDILPRLKENHLTHINVILPLRLIPSFDVHVAEHLKDLVGKAGFVNTRINFIPIGIDCNSFSRGPEVYFTPQQMIDRLKDQHCIWFVWDFGTASGQKIAHTVNYLLTQGIPSDDVLLRTVLVTDRSAKLIYNATRIPVYGFIICETGKEVTYVSSKEDNWIVKVDGKIVSAKDWDYETISISGKDEPHIARSYLNQLLGSIGSINTVVDSGISDTDIKFLEFYYWRKYLRDRLRFIGGRAFLNEQQIHSVGEINHDLIVLFLRELLNKVFIIKI